MEPSTSPRDALKPRMPTTHPCRITTLALETKITTTTLSDQIVLEKYPIAIATALCPYFFRICLQHSKFHRKMDQLAIGPDIQYYSCKINTNSLQLLLPN